MLDTKEKTWEFIDGLAKNEDVSNIKYTKVIIWLHSMGYAFDFCPPTWQVKKFINEDIGPYYQFHEDDKYFMKKGEEFAEEIKKKTKKATTRDVATAIFFYIAFKSMMPPRSQAKKDFTPATLIRFMKSKKMTLSKLSEKLADSEEKEALTDALYKFLSK